MDNQYNTTKTNAKQREDRKQTQANQQITNNNQNCREKLQTTHNSTLQAMFKKSSPGKGLRAEPVQQPCPAAALSFPLRPSGAVQLVRLIWCFRSNQSNQSSRARAPRTVQRNRNETGVGTNDRSFDASSGKNSPSQNEFRDFSQFGKTTSKPIKTSINLKVPTSSTLPPNYSI